MAKRKIIEIDRDQCNGCALCTTACAEGALELDAEGKAVLVKEIFCDGLGACLSVCPTGALKIIERDAKGYNAAETHTHVLETRGPEAAAQVHGAKRHSAPSSCPGSAAREIPEAERAAPGGTVSGRSELGQWPIQLHLVSPFAPYFEGSDLLVAADCTAFALGSFHSDLLKGNRLVIACPKLDETEGYAEKLAEIFRQNHLKSLTVAVMTVPCCSGLLRLVETALEISGVSLDLKKVVVGIDGRVVGRDRQSAPSKNID